MRLTAHRRAHGHSSNPTRAVAGHPTTAPPQVGTGQPGRPPTRGRRWLPYAVYAAVAVLVAMLILLLVMLAAPPTFAQPAPAPPAPPTLAPDVNTVLTNIRNWIMGILALLATVFLTVGGVRYIMSAGEPSEVGKAKEAFKHAGVGYGLAALAPLVVEILKGIVGA